MSKKIISFFASLFLSSFGCVIGLFLGVTFTGSGQYFLTSLILLFASL